jgi:hypothetical protein
MAFPPGFPHQVWHKWIRLDTKKGGRCGLGTAGRGGFEGDSQVELHVETQILGRIDGELTEELSVVSEDSDVEVVGE